MTMLAAPLTSTIPSSITVRRSAAIDVGGFETSIRNLYEDQAFLTKIYNEKPIYVINSCLAKHRVHSSSLMNSVAAGACRKMGIWQRDNRALLRWQSRYFDQHVNQHPVLDALIRQRKQGLKRLFFRGFMAMLRSRTRTVLRSALPSSAYLGIMGHRRRRLDNRTWQQLENLQKMLRLHKAPIESDQISSDSNHAQINGSCPK